MQQQPSPRASWPSGDDNGGFYLIVALICSGVGAYLLWSTFHAEISRAVMQVFHGEIGLARHLTDRFDLADRQMMRADPERVTLRDLWGISRDVGAFYRLPAVLLMLVLALVCLLRAAPSRFRRAFDMEGLIREQAGSFRTTAAFVGRRLGLVLPAPQDPRPADYALTSSEWTARYATTKAGGFDPAAARRNLVRQLGPRWRGLEAASPQVRCLLAACALHLAERRAEAQDLLGEVSAALAGTPGRDRPEGPDTPLAFPVSVVPLVDQVLLDHAVVSPALAAAGRHAFTHPALMSLLVAARMQAGVLAPGQFAWLKLVDRPFWYALHSLGFETQGAGCYIHPNPRAEAAGARDHWAVERLAGKPVAEPDVARAVAALHKAAAAQTKPGAPA